MKRGKGKRERAVTVKGPWVALPLNFLRSRAYAQLSPHASKLLGECLSMLGPNACGNGDISLAPKLMHPRGWTSRQTLGDAIKELIEAKILIKTRQGSRLDCSLFAITLYPLFCDLDKLDVKPGCYTDIDWMQDGGGEIPSVKVPVRWRRVRKSTPDARRGRSDAALFQGRTKSREFRFAMLGFVSAWDKNPCF
jgi:hypothetical protein